MQKDGTKGGQFELLILSLKPRIFREFLKPSESISAACVPPFLLVFLEMIHLNLTRPESLFCPIVFYLRKKST